MLIKVAFKSGSQFLSSPPRWRYPVGEWSDDIHEALLFDARLRVDGLVEWPWRFIEGRDGGAEIEEKFKRHLFPAGRPQLVQVHLKDRPVKWQA